VHPLDVRGKTPINLAKGVFPVSGGAISSLTPVAGNQEWKVLKTAPGNALSSNLVATGAPERVSRTLVGGNMGAHVVTLDRNSSIAYDAREHRFVNTNSAPTRTQEGVVANETTGKTSTANRVTGDAIVPGARASTTTAPARTSVPASRAMVPPPAPRSAESGRSGWSGGGFGPSSRSASSSAASTSGAHSAAAASSSAGSSSGGRAH
jgi:hypothetical protein